MSEKIVQFNEEIIKGQIKELVRGSVEETLNGLLEAEAEKLTQAARYERSEERQGYRSGHYSRNLTTTSGDVTLNVPRLKGITFETAIIERYRRRESSVEEALIEMYLAGVSVRRVEDITEALWGSKVSPSTISELNKKAYVHIEDWRNRPLQGGRYPYVYVDGIYLRRNWGGEYENVAILVAIAVNEDGYREVLGAAEGMKEDKSSWASFFQWLKGRGLDGVKLIVGDKCMGMLEAVGEVFPEAKYQRCVVHFYRNIFSVVPKSKVKLVAKMLKAIHAQESKKASREKAKAVVAELRAMKLKEAVQKIEDGVEETLTYADFPTEHWTRIRTNNVIERLNREIRRGQSQVLCKPPMWCRIEAPHRRFLLWEERIAVPKKTSAEQKSVNCCKPEISAAWMTSRICSRKPLPNSWKMDWMQNWMTNSVTASTITRTRKLTTAGMDTAARRCVPASVMWRFPYREIAKENMNRSF